MNIKEYIESGILELYVTGSLTDLENQEVEQMIAKHPELKGELAAIESTLISFSELEAPMELPSSILEGALGKINEEKTSTEAPKVVTEAKVVPINSGSTKMFKMSLAAAVTALCVSLIGNFMLFNSNADAQRQLSELRDEQSVFADDLQIQKANYNKLEDKFAMISDPNISKISLAGIEGKESLSAIVYWNKNNQVVALNPTNLPAVPEGKQYQLWALKDGVPIDAGVFDNDGTIQQVKNIASADAFAITLEDFGGKPTPDLSQLQVLGETV